MKIPVHQRSQLLTGHEIDDYLCCIGRGMIQFVCVREGSNLRNGGRNSSYRSLTADKIIIHPGSVMFRVDPQFIVAGEVVRTSRMYAMSVSPLSKQVLERISPEFYLTHARKNAAFIRADEENQNGVARRKSKKDMKKRESLSGEPGVKQIARDFTNNIKIGGEVFEIITVKGKKTVLLPWERLTRLFSEEIPKETIPGLKGKIIIKNKFNLLTGEKLELILSLAPVLGVENALSRVWPRKKNFNSQEDLAALLDHLDDLVRPVIWKKDSKDLGFLGLFTDGSGNYWFRASRGFHTSLNESLSSLETLIGELAPDGRLGKEIAIEQKHIVNQCYRRLSDYL